MSVPRARYVIPLALLLDCEGADEPLKLEILESLHHFHEIYLDSGIVILLYKYIGYTMLDWGKKFLIPRQHEADKEITPMLATDSGSIDALIVKSWLDPETEAQMHKNWNCICKFSIRFNDAPHSVIDQILTDESWTDCYHLRTTNPRLNSIFRGVLSADTYRYMLNKFIEIEDHQRTRLERAITLIIDLLPGNMGNHLEIRQRSWFSARINDALERTSGQEHVWREKDPIKSQPHELLKYCAPAPKIELPQTEMMGLSVPTNWYLA